MNKTIYRTSAIAALSILITACGGGGDGGTANTTTNTVTNSSTLSKYDGSWGAQAPHLCDIASGVSPKYWHEVYVFDSTTNTFKDRYDFYSTSDCSGTPAGTITYSATVSITGTDTISGKLVDKIQSVSQGVQLSGVTVTDSSWLTDRGNLKDIVYTDGTYLYSGTNLNNVNYPAALSTYVLKKQ